MAAAVPPAASPGKGQSPAGGSPAAAAPPGEAMPANPPAPAAAEPAADNLPPPPPPIAEAADAGAAMAPADAAVKPAPGTFVTTTAADAPVAQVMLGAKQEGAKKEYVAAVKSYEELVGGNVVRGKMYLESKPQYEAGPMAGMGFGGMGGGMGAGFGGQPMGGGYPQMMGGYDRPPVGYDRPPMGGGGGYGGYDRPPMGGGYDGPPQGGYGGGYDRPPDMYGPPRERYSPDRGRYPSPEYDRRPARERSPGRNDDYYYDELPRGAPSENKLPVTKKESENRAERVLQKIREDIEAFAKDDGAREDVADVPSSKPSGSLERRARAGPMRAMRRATDDYEDDTERPQRRRSRRGHSTSSSSSSSSSEDHRHHKKRHGSSDHGRKRSGSRRRSRTRSKRRDEEGERSASRRSRKMGQGREGEMFGPRPTTDRNFMEAGMLYRYESQPMMLVKGDVVKKEEGAAAAPGEDGGAPKNPEEGAGQQARFLPPDQYQDFLLDVRAGKKRLGYPVRATPSNVAQELGRYQDFLCGVFPEGTSPATLAAELGKYHQFILGTNAPRPSSGGYEFLMASNKGVAKVLKPTGSGGAEDKPPAGYQSFTVRAKPQLPKVKSDEEYHGFAVQAIPATPPKESSSDNIFTMQTVPRRIPSRPKGERYEHMEDTPQLKTEWWSRAAGVYDGTGRPASRSRSKRGRRGLARSASPRMISPNRQKTYDEENGDMYQVTSLEMEGPIGQQYAQVRMSRRPGEAGRMYSMNRKLSPTAVGYGGPQRVPSPEMLPMQMQGMQIGGMQGMQMQGVPMQAMQGMPMQGMPMQGMPMMGMPMQPMAMQGMPMQGMPVQYDPRSGRVPMRMDRRIHQILTQQKPGGGRRNPSTVMPVQAQVEGAEGVIFKYQVQNESRQRQADDGDTSTKDVLIETSKEPSVERVMSNVQVQVQERKVSKATNARVKTRASSAATHEAGSRKNAEAQAEIEEMPHVSFTRNPNYDAPPPGYPFPMGPMFQPPSPPPPQAQPSQVISTTTVHTHQHHHHYHDPQKNFKIAYLLPKSGDVRRDRSVQAQDRYEDQEPLGAAVGVQCMSLYERFMNWIYPDTKQTEDVSLMTDAEELTEDKKRPGKKGKKGAKKDTEGKPEDGKKDDKKGIGSESEAEAKGKSAEASEKAEKDEDKEKEEDKKKVPPGPPIPVNLPWQGHEYEYEEQIKPDGTRVGTYRYKGLGGAPKFPDDQGAKGALRFQDGQPSREPVAYETTTTRMEVDGQEFWQREVRPIPSSAREGPMLPMKGSRETYQRYERDQPSVRSVTTPQKRHVIAHSKARIVERGGKDDNFVPDVQIRLDFGDTSDNSGSRGSKTKSSGGSAAAATSWQPADMVVSYAHKNFDEKNMVDDDDDDDDMLPSGHVYGGHGSTKKLIRRKTSEHFTLNCSIACKHVVVTLRDICTARQEHIIVLSLLGHRAQSKQSFGLDRHLVLNASKFKAVQAGPANGGFWNAAPPVCKDARCLTRGSAAVKHLYKDYLKSACTDFYQFVCAQRNVTDSPRVIAYRALEDGVLNVIKAQDKFPELMTARHLYKECLNKEAISERGWDPLAELQESTDLSGWPFTDPVQQPLIWRAAARLLRRFNLPALLSIGVEKHPHKHGASILSIGHPELLLPSRVGNRSVKWYYGAVMHALTPFRERLVIPVFAVEVSTFESRLANMLRAHPKMAVKKLAEHPELAEARGISEYFLNIALENITHVTKSTEFLVKDVEFVDDLLAAIKETAPHIVLNYLGFREVVVASPFLPSKLQALSALGRSPALRKEICLGVIAESLPVMSLYAGFNAFKQGLHDFKAANVTGATKEAVSSFVNKISWMDDATRAKVSKKMVGSRIRTFHPGWISDKFKVFAQHENTDDLPIIVTSPTTPLSWPVLESGGGVSSNSSGKNVVNKVEGLSEITEIEKEVLICGLVVSASCVNLRPVYLLQNVVLHFCSAKLIGAGDHASPYSQPTWSDTTKKHFKNMRQCFAKQLSETSSQNASKTEILSVVADAAAISPSFKVYKKFVSQKNIDGKSFVKAFNMDVDQFFFVSYASSYCGTSPPVKPSQHSEVTNGDRVNTALKNSPEFHAAFRCPSKRAMNPAHRCQLWHT
ncbi:hypothetical protein HPB50_017893 [Hyalomma asiaticum]|uniref:Uncharacterized protein n=1 Tax=Hyalomma asiaticum TaxID=266040 RepID=A0ACB7T7L3_HYAAI|nr:hypothetical protein HPB50_017893 [Hyalomma asiaticum]